MSLTLRYARPYSTRVVLYVLLTVLSVVFTMATALSVADFLKILFGEGDTSVVPATLVSQWLDGLYRWLISFGRLNALILFSGIIFVLYSLKNIFGYLSAVEIATLRTAVVRDMRADMFRKAMHLPLAYYDSHRKGDVLSRFGNDMVEYDETSLGSIQQLLTAVISMVLYLAMLLYLNLKLTGFVLCMLPLVAFVISSISRKLKRQSKEVQEMNARLVSLTDETIGGLKVIKAYTAIDFSNSRFQEYNRDYTRRRNAMYRRIDAASPVSEFLGTVMICIVLCFGGALIILDKSFIDAPTFIFYMVILYSVIQPIKDLSKAAYNIPKGLASMERIDRILKAPNNITEAPDAKELESFGDEIVYDHVSFSYEPGREVLHDISFRIGKGRKIALVGASGGGKSTLVDLLPRFYDVSSGSITIDGHDIRGLKLRSLRSLMGNVNQDPILFNDTIFNNIAFGLFGNCISPITIFNFSFSLIWLPCK